MSVAVTPNPTDKPKDEKTTTVTVETEGQTPQTAEVLEDTPEAYRKRREKEQADLAAKQNQSKPAENK